METSPLQGDDASSLLAQLPDGILMLDAGGAILSANPAAERIFGASTGGLGGCGAELLGIDAATLPAAADGSARETIGRSMDGAAVALELKISAMSIAAHQRFAVMVRDATQQRDLDQRNRATDERRRKHFTTATHELRTPMASILGFSELLLKREYDPATSRELVEIIHRQAERLVDLINQLLDLARIEAGGIQGLQIGPVALAELLNQTMAGLNGLGQNHRIQLELDDGLPLVAADFNKLQQALTNIISNAIKYSSAGSRIDIAAFSRQRDGQQLVAIRVADRGIGMSCEQRTRMFDAFYRAGEAPDVQGSGLGMTIFKEIVDLHGGRAEVQSQPGNGTTVTVWLAAGVARG